VPTVSLAALAVAAGGLALGAAATFFLAVAPALVSFFAATGLTSTFEAVLVPEAFFGANGTADFDVGDAAATLGFDDAVFDLASATLGFEGAAVALTDTTLGFDDAVADLAGTTLTLVGALVLTTAALDFAGVAAGLAAESFAAGCLIPSASLEAAVLFCCTVFNWVCMF